MTQTLTTLTSALNRSDWPTTWNAALDAILTQHGAATQPSYVQTGTVWFNSTSKAVSFYDGSQDVTLYTIDATNHLVMAPIGGGVATVTGATTTDIGAVPQTALTISGTATITSFGTSMLLGQVKFLTFSGASVLTHNDTSLILPGAANITTAAGDTAIVQCLASGNYRVFNYLHVADGVDFAPKATPLFTGNVGVGVASASFLSHWFKNGTAPTLFYSNGYNDANGIDLVLHKTRGTTSLSTTSTNNGDTLGSLTFSGSDGTSAYVSGAVIKAFVDGTPSTNILPTTLKFYTRNAAGTLIERLRLNAAGNVYVGGGSIGNALQYLQVMNTDTGSSAGSVVEALSGDVAGTGYCSGGFSKMKTGAMNIYNQETNVASCINVMAGGTGGVTLAKGATSWAAISDIRKKTVKGEIEDPLAIVSAIRALKFNYKTDEAGQPVRVGFSAQDVQKVYPEAVNVGVDDDKTLSLWMDNFIPLHHEALIALYNEIAALKQKVAALEGHET